MKTVIKNGRVVNVFTGVIEKKNILIGDGVILGVGDYADADADTIRDVGGAYVCPGFIDGHIHIESCMLSPAEFARAAVVNGTTTVIADPHEIANVCGADGIRYMLAASEGAPVTIYFTLPSCVPATPFDDNGASLDAAALAPLYGEKRVIGLGEVMHYTGVVARDAELMKKIADARSLGRIVNGHAPLLTGRALDAYISAGIADDHECSTVAEAMEKISKGQRVMIRQGTAARNLSALLPLFDEPWAHRCLLVTDDKQPAELIEEGHIDHIIRSAARAGKSAVTAIRMATLWAAEHFGLRYVGAVAPGYAADLTVLDDIDEVSVRDVYHRGVRVVKDGELLPYEMPRVDPKIELPIRHAFRLGALTEENFHIACDGVRDCRVIRLIPGELITDPVVLSLDFSRENGIDTSRDILKIAVLERHHATGRVGLGYIQGIGLRAGAIASSVSHDSHNLIVIGASERDMAAAGNAVRAMNGGCVTVRDGKVLAQTPLPLAGLMSDQSATSTARMFSDTLKAAYTLGAHETSEPFMTMAFISLPVIPHIKITTRGLVDVDRQEIVPLFVDA